MGRKRYSRVYKVSENLLTSFAYYYSLIIIINSTFRYDSLLIEYALYLPFGLVVASSFLQTLHSKEPPEFDQLPVEETIRQIFDKGGNVVDAELRSLIADIYNMHSKLNLSLEKI